MTLPIKSGRDAPLPAGTFHDVVEHAGLFATRGAGPLPPTKPSLNRFGTPIAVNIRFAIPLLVGRLQIHINARTRCQRPPDMLSAAIKMKRGRLQSIKCNNDLALDPMRERYAHLVDMNRHATRREMGMASPKLIRIG